MFFFACIPKSPVFGVQALIRCTECTCFWPLPYFCVQQIPFKYTPRGKKRTTRVIGSSLQSRDTMWLLLLVSQKTLLSACKHWPCVPHLFFGRCLAFLRDKSIPPFNLETKARRKTGQRPSLVLYSGHDISCSYCG